MVKSKRIAKDNKGFKQYILIDLGKIINDQLLLENLKVVNNLYIRGKSEPLFMKQVFNKLRAKSRKITSNFKFYTFG